MTNRSDLMADIDARSGFQLDITRFEELLKYRYALHEEGGCRAHFTLDLNETLGVSVEIDLFDGKGLNYDTFSITDLRLILFIQEENISIDTVIKDILLLKTMYEKLVESSYNGRFERWDSGYEFIFDSSVTSMIGLSKVLDDFAQLRDFIK